jgi:hypothetical protein
MASIINATTSSGVAVSGDTSGVLQLATNGGTTAVTIDTSQNVGIGTSSPSQKLEVNGNAKTLGYYIGYNTGLYTTDSTISNYSSTNGVYLNGNASGFLQLNGDGANRAQQISIQGGSSSYITFITATAERMRIDTSGNVGIGETSTGNYRLGLSGNNAVVAVGISMNDTGTSGKNYTVRSDAGSFIITDNTAGAERMRITSSGGLLIGTTSGNTSGGKLQVANNYLPLNIYNNNNASGDFGMLSLLGSNCNNTSSYHAIWATGGGDKCYILGNGNLQNVNNSYGALSDAKLKENIVDATPKLDDLMKVKVRNYNLKSDPEQKQIGVVAQELEQVFPAMVEEAPDMDSERNILETTTKSVKYSVFVPMLIKAIQEQQALITTLQTQVAELKQKVGA